MSLEHIVWREWKLESWRVGGEAGRQAGSNGRAVLLLCPTARRADLEGNRGKLTGVGVGGGSAVTRCSYISGRQFGMVYPMRVNSCRSAIDQSFPAWVCRHAGRWGQIHFWMTEPLMKRPQIIYTKNIQRWGNQEDLWSRKSCISRFIRISPCPCHFGSGPNQIYFKRLFYNVPFNYFTYKRHGSTDSREDPGIIVIITTCNKNKYAHLGPKHIRSTYSEGHKSSALNLSLRHMPWCNVKSVVVILHMPLLRVWPYLLLLLFWIILSAPLGLTRWQVYWVIKFERQEHYYTTRLSGSHPSAIGARNGLITPVQHSNSILLFCSPAWPTHTTHFRWFAVITEKKN